MAMRLDEAVVITDTELTRGYGRLGSRLQGHLSPVLPSVDVASDASTPTAQRRSAEHT